MAAESRVVGRYTVHEELASGGMATVHLGRLNGPEKFSRTVAIKRLHARYAKDAQFSAMFRDEARLVARIRHPNVVPTLDIISDADEIFIVMEYVVGESLSKLLSVCHASGEAIPLPVLATVVSSVLHGLHAAHETRDERGELLGIVHRDVSPHNIMVGVDGTARVLDFGVAKAGGRAQTTRDGELKGKLSYMAPEQLSGAAATRRSDVYATAVVLWEALTGRRLFSGDTEVDIFASALRGEIAPPSKYNALVSPAVDALVLRALARDPLQRFATAREMAVAIEQTIGLATPSTVGEWVERWAHDALARRAVLVNAVESAARATSNAPPPTEAATSGISHTDARPSPSPAPIATSFAAWQEPRGMSRGRMSAVIGAFALLAIGGGVLAALAGREPPAKLEEPRRPLAESARSIEYLAAASTAAPLPATSGSSAAPSTITTAPVQRPILAAPRPKAVSCDPPYVTDPATGRRTYKRECLH